MSQLINLQDLSKLFALQARLSNEEAELFVNIFFQLLEAGLLRDDFVKIDHFGTSKILENQRKSTTIRPTNEPEQGERYTLTFETDELLGNLVNKPFAHFSPIVLHKDTQPEELEAVEVLACVQEDEQRNTFDDEELPILVLEQDAAVVNWPLTTASNSEANTQQVQATAAYPPMEQAQEEMAAPPPSTEDKPSALGGENTNLPMGDSQTPTNAQPDKADSNQRISLENSHKRQPNESKESDQQCKDYSAQLDATIVDENHEKTTKLSGTIRIQREETQQLTLPTKLGKKIFLLLLLILLCGLSFMAGHQHWFWKTETNQSLPLDTLTKPGKQATSHVSPSPKRTTNEADLVEDQDLLYELGKNETFIDTTAAPKQQAPRTPQKTSSLAKTTQAAEKASTEKPQKSEEKKPQKTKNVAEYTVKKGENIYQIAERILGSRAYAKQIVQHNALSNPDHITEGQILKIPQITQKSE